MREESEHSIGEIEDRDAVRLLEADSAQSRAELYIRMLYSSRYVAAARQALELNDSRLPAQTALFLRTVDFNRLKIEQRARHRNLAYYLGKFCSAFFSLISEEERLALVSHFSDSTDFWLRKGRTLAENFCLVVWRSLSEGGQPFLADVARLEGVSAGLSAAPYLPTPWNNQASLGHEQLELAGGVAAERFVSRWCLLDNAGRLPGRDNLGILMAIQPGQYRMTVSMEIDGAIKIEMEQSITGE